MLQDVSKKHAWGQTCDRCRFATERKKSGTWDCSSDTFHRRVDNEGNYWCWRFEPSTSEGEVMKYLVVQKMSLIGAAVSEDTDEGRWICRANTLEDAEMICEALNNQEPKESDEQGS